MVFSPHCLLTYKLCVFQVMCGECDESAWGFNYELFTHQTTFFGMKCVFLGCYNGQKLGAVDDGRHTYLLPNRCGRRWERNVREGAVGEGCDARRGARR